MTFIIQTITCICGVHNTSVVTQICQNHFFKYFRLSNISNISRYRQLPTRIREKEIYHTLFGMGGAKRPFPLVFPLQLLQT